MNNNEWRYVKYKPGAAHLWGFFYKTVYGHDLWKSKCGRISTLGFDASTIRLEDDSPIKKCKQCLAIAERSAMNPTQEAA